MDANDKKLIDEQIHLLQNTQHTVQHAMKNQLQVLNSTITHLDKLENMLDYNGRLITHQIREYSIREEIDEHFTVILAMIADLTSNAKDVIEYLTYIRKGTMHPILTPIENIITQLQKAAAQGAQGLYFSFKLSSEEWLNIEEYVKISAYRDGPKIFTVLQFPLISQPAYDVVWVIPANMTEKIYSRTRM